MSLMRYMPFEAGLSGADIDLDARTYLAQQVYVKGVAVTATVTYRLDTDGDLTVTLSPSGSGTPAATEWHVSNPSTGIGSDWDVRATVTSGSLTSGSVAWQQISSNRSWTKSLTSFGGSSSVTLTFEFRENGGPGTVLSTTTGVVLTAQII